MSKVLLVIAPHADDEAIGCGGTILRLVARGFSCRVMRATDAAEGATREREHAAALAIAGATMLPGLGFAERGVDASAEAVERVTELLFGLAPKLVLAPHYCEIDPDHQATARITRAALRLALARGMPPASLLEYEVWTPLPRPQLIVDVSDFMDRKLAMIRCYTSQLASRCYDRAAFGLNRYRALLHGKGGGFAEAFSAPKIEGGWAVEDVCTSLG